MLPQPLRLLTGLLFLPLQFLCPGRVPRFRLPGQPQRLCLYPELVGEIPQRDQRLPFLPRHHLSLPHRRIPFPRNPIPFAGDLGQASLQLTHLGGLPLNPPLQLPDSGLLLLIDQGDALQLLLRLIQEPQVPFPFFPNLPFLRLQRFSPGQVPLFRLPSRLHRPIQCASNRITLAGDLGQNVFQGRFPGGLRLNQPLKLAQPNLLVLIGQHQLFQLLSGLLVLARQRFRPGSQLDAFIQEGLPFLEGQPPALQQTLWISGHRVEALHISGIRLTSSKLRHQFQIEVGFQQLRLGLQ